eukprot:COSAG02_NODE_1388_length_12920_cov_8.638122_6_plen_51_part_00
MEDDEKAATAAALEGAQGQAEQMDTDRHGAPKANGVLKKLKRGMWWIRIA